MVRFTPWAIARSGLHAFEEARPIVQLIVTLRLCTALVLLAPTEALLRPATARGVLAFITANSAVYLFNGLCDQIEDRRNGKDRPLARGTLTTGAAQRWLLVLTMVSLLLAASDGWLLTAIVCGQLLAGLVYSWTPLPWMRRQAWPVLLISYAGLATYGAAAVLSPVTPSPALACLGLTMTAWMAFVGGILKDLPDVAGDREAGRCTTAVVHGVHCAALRGRASAWSCAVVMLTGGVLFRSVPILAASGVLLIAACAIHLGTRRSATSEVVRRKAPYRAFMRGQYAAHLVIVATCLVWP